MILSNLFIFNNLAERVRFEPNLQLVDARRTFGQKSD